MTPTVAPAQVLDALVQRLATVAEVLDPDAASSGGDSVAGADRLLHDLIHAIRRDPRPSRVWLLRIGLSATYPTNDEVRELQRKIELDRPEDLVQWLLADAGAAIDEHGSGQRTLELVTDRFVVDVDFSAKDDLHTGIQRVVRHVAPRWSREHDIELAVWTATAGAYRAPTDREQTRVLRWGADTSGRFRPDTAPVIVPWNTTIVLPEVPGFEQLDRLAAVAEHSGNRVVLVGYDCIPIVAADLVSDRDAARFTRYLTLVKHASKVVAISNAVGDEFRGFARALAAQGLQGPQVEVCSLGVDAPSSAEPGPVPVAEPEIAVVGSLDRRKNQSGVLYAAEVLWLEGHRFTLRLIGNPGWGSEAIYDEVERLQALGRSVAIERGISDEDLWRAYQRASFTVFPTLQEGFGLPVVESLSFGTPVVTSNYGSVAEIAAGGGTVLVDPRDDVALTDAFRTLLTEPEVLSALAAEAGARCFKTWDQYAAELWDEAVSAR